MRSIIVLALGLFATQAVGVHLAANANADANQEVDQCSIDLALDLIESKVGGGYAVDYDDFNLYVWGLAYDTLSPEQCVALVAEANDKMDPIEEELSAMALAGMIARMGNAEAKRAFQLSHKC